MKNSLLTLFLINLAFQLPAQEKKAAESMPPSRVAREILNPGCYGEKSLKGGGDVFWTEEFNWGDSTSGIGWKLPSGWTLEDPGDLGYNWHWANDTLKGVYTNEPILASDSRANGCLALNLDAYNQDLGYYNNYLPVDNSIVSPKIDCSGHSSVLVRLAQNFRYWSEADMLFDVTSDGGGHWASYDMKMGTLYSERVGHVAAGGKVDLILNITDVAAGAPEVQFRITWRKARLYYWMIDDITFMEGWNNDIQMLYYQADYDNGTDSDEGFFYSVPKTQISGYDMMAIFHNFGNLEQWDTRLEVNVTKNNQVIWSQATTPFVFYPGLTDTFRIAQQFIPEDFGHYKVDFEAKMENVDEIPDDNSGTMPFQVTDSVFSRCDDQAELSWSTWGWYEYGHEGDYMGTWYTIKNDIEINSISVYINNADINASFRLVLMGYNAEDDALFELLTSETVSMDSTILKNHWVTLPLLKDGESEFLKAGDSYLASIQFWNNLDYPEAYNSHRYSIGSDRSNYYPSGQCWFYLSNDDTWYSSGTDLFMIRMNLDDHSNQVDGIRENQADMIELLQNYPNPFSGETTISYDLTAQSDVKLTVRDISGRIVWYNEYSGQLSGRHEIILNSSEFESGNYFYTLTGDKFGKTLQMTVIR